MLCYAIGIAMDNLNNKGYGQSTDWIMRYLFLEELNYMRYWFVIRGGAGGRQVEELLSKLLTFLINAKLEKKSTMWHCNYSIWYDHMSYIFHYHNPILLISMYFSLYYLPCCIVKITLTYIWLVFYDKKK